MKNDMTENNLEAIDDHPLTSRANRDNCTQVRDDMSLSKSLNFHIRKVAKQIKIPRKRRRVAKNSWNCEIFNYDNSIKT